MAPKLNILNDEREPISIFKKCKKKNASFIYTHIQKKKKIRKSFRPRDGASG